MTQSYLAQSHLAQSHLSQSHLTQSHLAKSHLAKSHLTQSHLAAWPETAGRPWAERADRRRAVHSTAGTGGSGGLTIAYPSGYSSTHSSRPGRPRCLYCTQAGCVGFTRDFHPDILGLIMTFNYGLGELNQRGSFQQHVDQ